MQQQHLRSGRYLAEQPSGLGHLSSPLGLAYGSWFDDYGPFREQPKPVVYYLERGDGLIKIGCTFNYPRRRSQLLKQHGPLSLVAWEEGDSSLEHTRHTQFDDLRADPIAEWFRPGVSLIDWILNVRALMA